METPERRCACGVARSTSDPELVESPHRGGGIGFNELQPPRLAQAVVERVRFLRACRQCGGVYLPPREAP